VAITVTSPGAPGLVGPGIQLTLHSSLIGPIGTDWAWRVRPTLASGLVVGNALVRASGSHDQGIVLGVFHYPGLSLRVPEPPVGALAGTAITLDCDLVASNFFTVEDSGTLAGWSWDPVSGLYALIADWVGSSGDSLSSQILAAVSRQLQNAP
jgi:hypothetical protein